MKNKISNALREMAKSPENLAATCAISLATDCGASAIVAIGALAAKPAFTRAKALVTPPLESNHRLLQLVHETKWKAVAVIAQEVSQSQETEYTFNNCDELQRVFHIANFQAKQEIGKKIDARDGRQVKSKWPFAERAALLMRGLTDSSDPEVTYTDADRNLLEEISTFLAREPQQGTLSEDLFEIAEAGAREQVLNDLSLIRYRSPEGEPHEYHEKRKTNKWLEALLTQLEHPKRGWGPTYRVMLKTAFGKPENEQECKQVTLSIASETLELTIDHKALIKGLEDTLVDRLDDIDAHLVEIATRLTPKLRLDPLGGELRVDARRFKDFVYSSRKTDFVGRDKALAQLLTFMDVDTPLSWWQIAGDGGQGKSRLALELVRQAQREGWHAGFLQSSTLKDFKDWATLDIDQPTLCVIDYAAAPEKATMLAEALEDLWKRTSNDHPDWDTPIRAPLRVLIVERAPYDTSGDAGMQAFWYSAFFASTGGYGGAIASLAHHTSALDLEDLTDEDMLYIAKSWCKERELDWPEDANTKLLQLLGKNDEHDSDEERERRAWRPLFAMVIGEMLCREESEIDGMKLGDFIKVALQEEQTTRWLDQHGEPMTLTPQACRLAMLASIIGELDLQNTDLDSEFYAPGDTDTVLTAWKLSGFSVTLDDDLFGAASPPLPARTPDLFGEYLTCLLAPKSGDIDRLMKDAWRLDPIATTGFLIRLSEDREDLDVTKSFRDLAHTEPSRQPSGNKGALIYRLNRAAHNNLTGVLVQHLRHPEVDPNGRLPSGAFPLLLAARKGHTETVSALVNADDIDPNQTHTVDGIFPLLIAAYAGHSETVSALLKAEGIDPNKTHTKLGVFPLLAAAREGHPKTVSALLKAEDIDPNKTRPKDGSFPLLLAAQYGHTETVRALVNADNSDPNKTNPKNGTFPLLLAAEYGHTEAVNALIKAEGIDPNKTHSEDGTFALSMAAQNGHTETISALINVDSIDINQVDEGVKLSALMIASVFGHCAIIEALIPAGANIKKICEPHKMNSLELCLQWVDEAEDEEKCKPLLRSARCLVALGATLQDGTVPEIPKA